jgi:hypothetical protein
MTLTEANANYLRHSDLLSAAHAEVRALTANKKKTKDSVNAVYDRLAKVTKDFNIAKDALDAAERA